MANTVEQERAAIEADEKKLADRRRKLVEREQSERQRVIGKANPAENASAGLRRTSSPVAFAQAPRAGSLLLRVDAADKGDTAFTPPAGWTLVDKLETGAIAEIKGVMSYRIADGTETGPITTRWTLEAEYATEMLEIEGPFPASGALVATGSDKTQAQKSTVALTASPAVAAVAAVALAFYMNDSRNTSYGSNRVASGGFTLLDPVPVENTGTGGDPQLIGARRVFAAAETPATTIGHTGTADGSIGFLAVFRKG